MSLRVNATSTTIGAMTVVIPHIHIHFQFVASPQLLPRLFSDVSVSRNAHFYEAIFFFL